MTRRSKKDEEIEISKIFLRAYFFDLSQIEFAAHEDNNPDKIDVIAYEILNPKVNNFNFQIKIIPYHPFAKEQEDYNDEMGAYKAYAKGAKARIKVYDRIYFPWKTALIDKLDSLDYRKEIRKNIDMLFLINDATLPDSDHSLNDLFKYGFRSTSCILIDKDCFVSMVLHASCDSALVLRENILIKKISGQDKLGIGSKNLW